MCCGATCKIISGLGWGQTGGVIEGLGGERKEVGGGRWCGEWEGEGVLVRGSESWFG